MDQVFTLWAILAAILSGLIAGLVALVVRAVRRDPAPKALLRGLEALVLAIVGGLLARIFIGIMLAIGDSSNTAVTVTSLLFFIWPGLVNLIALPFADPWIGPQALLWLAQIFGSLVGFYSGLYATYKWLGLGPVEFLLDVTWGLPGNVNGVIMHLINTGWGGHADGVSASGNRETRQGVHRYRNGFALRPGFAFTQGAVMSSTFDRKYNVDHDPGTSLFRHERIHVWQNRLLGPFFWFSYMGWMGIVLIPALVAGLIDSRRRVADALIWWTYFNNPWEIMAYGLANPTARTSQLFLDKSKITAWCCWPMGLAIPLSVLGVVILAAVFLLIFLAGYAA